MHFCVFVRLCVVLAFAACVVPRMVHGIGMHVMHVMHVIHHMIIIMFIVLIIIDHH
jgi:hypothetical protein